MNLDFSKLDNLRVPRGEMKPEPKTLEKSSKNPPIPDSEPSKMVSTTAYGQELAHIKLTREQAERARTKEVYSQYQGNIAKAGNIRNEILKGLKAGESTTALLLKACQCISSMTGESLFCKQVEKDLMTIYGRTFLDPAPLGMELDGVRGRLSRLQQALEKETEPEPRHKIEMAIEAHKQKALHLEELLREAEK